MAAPTSSDERRHGSSARAAPRGARAAASRISASSSAPVWWVTRSRGCARSRAATQPATARLMRRAPWEPPITRIRSQRSPSSRAGVARTSARMGLPVCTTRRAGQAARRLRERRRHQRAAAREQARGPTGNGVLLEQRDRDAQRAGRQHHGHAHVARAADDDVGPEVADDAPRRADRRREQRGEARHADGVADVEPGDAQRLEAEARPRSPAPRRPRRARPTTSTSPVGSARRSSCAIASTGVR